MVILKIPTEIPTPAQFNNLLRSWSDILKKPLWYKEIMPVLLQNWQSLPKTDEVEKLKDRTYQFFANKLTAGEINLAKSGSDFDQWRQSIDTVVIHYTGNKPGISWQTLSAIGLIRQYAADYFRYDDVWGIDIKNTPIWSGHFRNNQQVFYAYHWLVRLDGSFERLLDDKYIGWHAGNSEVNKKSVGIVLDGEFVDIDPPETALEGVAKIIRENYRNLPHGNILGHREVNPQTVCPGNLFISSWKNKILGRVTNK